MNQESNSNVQKNNNLVNKNTAGSKRSLLFVFLIIIVIVAGIVLYTVLNNKEQNSGKIKDEIKMSDYRISGNSLEPFDLYFLQLENTKSNKVYSPLSIKYALAMLNEGTTGTSREQIENIIGNYSAKKYTNSSNMSFANAMFIKDTYANSINTNYKNILMDKYNAEVKTDAFKTSEAINSWVNDKTLGLINNLFDNVSDKKFVLINALGIDMEWQEKFFHCDNEYGCVMAFFTSYNHEKFSWATSNYVARGNFKDLTEQISGMQIAASFNNYDIVNVLGEDNIRKTVKQAFEEYLKENVYENISDYFTKEEADGLTDEQLMEKYLDRYIESINLNYKREDKNTDFSFYTDDNVKVFAKDLKEYNSTNLQYVGIMPIKEGLDSYINKITASDINTIISNLKELKRENFKDGVVTKITGFIPKFKFDYSLNLKQDLNKLGITNIFEKNKASLTNITSDNSLFVNETKHKANIEFSQYGIKASATTSIGGTGAGGRFDYIYEIPVEEIDLTFDKPYMFIIRDKNSGEVWFTGTVYNPLLYSEDETANANVNW